MIPLQASIGHQLISFLGHLGAPSDVQAAGEIINLPLFPTPIRFPVVNLVTILKSKLAAYFIRTAKNNLDDLAWLVRRYRHLIPPYSQPAQSTESQKIHRWGYRSTSSSAALDSTSAWGDLRTTLNVDTRTRDALERFRSAHGSECAVCCGAYWLSTTGRINRLLF
jgi:hypothetical protein